MSAKRWSEILQDPWNVSQTIVLRDMYQKQVWYIWCLPNGDTCGAVGVGVYVYLTSYRPLKNTNQVVQMVCNIFENYIKAHALVWTNVYLQQPYFAID